MAEPKFKPSSYSEHPRTVIVTERYFHLIGIMLLIKVRDGSKKEGVGDFMLRIVFIKFPFHHCFLSDYFLKSSTAVLKSLGL